MANTESLLQANEWLGEVTAPERIEWAIEKIPEGLYALTSAGIDATVMLDLLSDAPKNLPVIHINTGFVPEETLAHRDILKEFYELDVREFGPSERIVNVVKRLQLWDSDLDLYSGLTKRRPLVKAIRELGAKALISGVRREQTEERAELDFVDIGLAGEVRLHPILDWTEQDIQDYKNTRGLEPHPLADKGYGSVDDINLMLPGVGRSGRIRNECSIHTSDGKVRRQQVS